MIENILTNFSETHRIFSYFIIFLSILIEGEIILLLAGILSHGGYLNFFCIILIAFGATLIHDLIYWSIGKELSKTNKKKFLFINLEKLKEFLEGLSNKNGFYIFISKFAWTLNKIILIAIGYIKVPIKRLLYFSIPAGFIWVITFVLIGNIFASETNILRKDLRTAGLFLSGLIIIVFIFENILRKIIEKRTKIQNK